MEFLLISILSKEVDVDLEHDASLLNIFRELMTLIEISLTKKL